MKNKICLTFVMVFIINIILAILLCKYNDLEIKDTLILLIGSYIVYIVLNLYLVFLTKTKQMSNYNLLLIVGTICCLISSFYFIWNIKNDTFLYFPLMYISSLLCTFINWLIKERKEK